MEWDRRVRMVTESEDGEGGDAMKDECLLQRGWRPHLFYRNVGFNGFPHKGNTMGARAKTDIIAVIALNTLSPTPLLKLSIVPVWTGGLPYREGK